MKTKFSILLALFCLPLFGQTNWIGVDAYNQVLNDLGYTKMEPTQVIQYNPTHRQLVFAQTNGTQFIIVGVYTTAWAQGWGYAARAYWYPPLGAPYTVDRYIEDQFLSGTNWVAGNPKYISGLLVYTR